MTYLLHNLCATKEEKVNSNYNTIDEFAYAEGVCTFDGVYKNVYKFWKERPEAFEKKQFIFFVMGDYVGGDNSFDVGMPHEEYCTWDEVIEIAHALKGEIGWHTWSHPDLCKVDDETLIKEITPPFPMRHFGYPYGRSDARVRAAVEEAGFGLGWSVTDGDGSDYQMLRSYL